MDPGRSKTVPRTPFAAERAARAEPDALLAEPEMARGRLEDMFRKAPAFICIIRMPDFIFEFANDAYYQLVGHREIIGKSVFDAIPDARSQGFEELLQRVLDTGEPFVGSKLPLWLERMPGAPLEERYVDFVYAPIKGADSSPSGIFVHGIDVTDHVQSRQAAEAMNAQLTETAAELAEQTRNLTAVAAELAIRQAEAVAAHVAQESNRVKTEFLTVMSHELRTPLNAIGGYVDLLELGVLGPVTDEQAKALARIQLSQRHLLGLINGVLNYSRVEAGAVQYVIGDVLLRDVLATCEALTDPQARAKGLTCRYDGCDSQLSVHADSEKVSQIVVNLVTNAVKFTEPGGSITLGCSVCDEGAAAVWVSDTGRGIRPDQLERVFQPFVQVDARLTRSQEGMGLGLAISRELARGMGGDLTVESEAGVGSTFRLTLPRSETNNAAGFAAFSV